MNPAIFHRILTKNEAQFTEIANLLRPLGVPFIGHCDDVEGFIASTLTDPLSILIVRLGKTGFGQDDFFQIARRLPKNQLILITDRYFDHHPENPEKPFIFISRENLRNSLPTEIVKFLPDSNVG